MLITIISLTRYYVIRKSRHNVTTHLLTYLLIKKIVYY